MKATRNDSPGSAVTVLLVAAALVALLFLGKGVLGGFQLAMNSGITLSSVVLFLAKALVVVFVASLAIGIGSEAWRLLNKQKPEERELEPEQDQPTSGNA